MTVIVGCFVLVSVTTAVILGHDYVSGSDVTNAKSTDGTRG